MPRWRADVKKTAWSSPNRPASARRATARAGTLLQLYVTLMWLLATVALTLAPGPVNPGLSLRCCHEGWRGFFPGSGFLTLSRVVFLFPPFHSSPGDGMCEVINVTPRPNSRAWLDGAILPLGAVFCVFLSSPLSACPPWEWVHFGFRRCRHGAVYKDPFVNLWDRGLGEEEGGRPGGERARKMTSVSRRRWRLWDREEKPGCSSGTLNW